MDFQWSTWAASEIFWKVFQRGWSIKDEEITPDFTPLSACRLSRIQNEFLHPPIVHIGDEYNVLGWTGEAMRPIELFGSTTRFAEHSQNLSIQCEFIETAGLLINREQILSRSTRRNTERPGSRPIGGIGICITKCGMPLFIIGDVQPDKLLEIAIRIENLNTSVAPISDVHISLFVDLHVMRISELTGSGAVRSPRLDPVSILVHLADA